MLGLWGYAVMVTAVNGAVVIALGRVGWRVARCGDRRPISMSRAAWSPALGVAAGLLTVEQCSSPFVRRRLESWVNERTNDVLTGVGQDRRYGDQRPSAPNLFRWTFRVRIPHRDTSGCS